MVLTVLVEWGPGEAQESVVFLYRKKSILKTEMEHSGTGVLDYKSTNRIVEVMDLSLIHI